MGTDVQMTEWKRRAAEGGEEGQGIIVCPARSIGGRAAAGGFTDRKVGGKDPRRLLLTIRTWAEWLETEKCSDNSSLNTSAHMHFYKYCALSAVFYLGPCA